MTGEGNVSTQWYRRTKRVTYRYRELLQSPLLSYRYTEEDEDERRDIESTTRSSEKRSDTTQLKGLAHRSQRHRWGEGSQQPREGQRKHGGPERVRRIGEDHIDLSMREWEDVGGVDEWHRAFTWRIEGPEQEDEETDETDIREVRARDVVAKRFQPIWGKVNRSRVRHP